MSNYILSVKPKFVEKILSGEKKFEYRRLVPKNIAMGDKVYIYSSAPVKKVIGYFVVSTIAKESKEALWRKTSEAAGIDKKHFDEYFHGKDYAYAYIIPPSRLHVFKEPKDLSEFGIDKAPQNYLKVKDYIKLPEE